MKSVCYVVIPGAAKGKRIGLVELGELGYYHVNYDHHETEEQCREHTRLINDSRGISAEVEEAMLCGSMFGWNVPAAQPAINHFASQS